MIGSQERGMAETLIGIVWDCIFLVHVNTHELDHFSNNIYSVSF